MAAKSSEEKRVRQLLTQLTTAIRTKNAAALIGLLARDEVTFDLAPPLLLNPRATHSPARWKEWFATWKGPIVSKSSGLKVEVSENLAYAYALQHMTGTQADGEKVDFWFRVTACFRREGKRWWITHMHNSVPFAMDGSEKALLNLKPRGRRR
jgi:ketosteroid isomerase-like protein